MAPGPEPTESRRRSWRLQPGAGIEQFPSVSSRQRLLQRGLPPTQSVLFVPPPRQSAGGVAAHCSRSLRPSSPSRTLAQAARPLGGHHCPLHRRFHGHWVSAGWASPSPDPVLGLRLQDLHSGAQRSRWLAWRPTPGPVAREVQPGLGSVAVMPPAEAPERSAPPPERCLGTQTWKSSDVHSPPRSQAPRL